MAFDWLERLLRGQQYGATMPPDSTAVGYGSVLAPQNEPVDVNGDPMYPTDTPAGTGVLKPGYGLDKGGQVVGLNDTQRPFDATRLGPTPVGQTPETQQQQAQHPSPAAAPVEKTPAGDVGFLTNDPEAMAKADKAQRHSRMWNDVGYQVGTIARMVAGAYGGGGAMGGAGGGAAAGGGADAGAADGGAGGFMSSMQGMGGGIGDAANAYSSYESGDYGQAGKSLMSLASKYMSSSKNGGAPGGQGGDGYLMPGEAPHGQSGGGFLNGDEFNYLFGAKNRRAAMAEAGLLPEFSPESSYGDWKTWS